MLYYKVKLLKAKDFRRLTGVQKGTFAKMAEVIKDAEVEKYTHGGRPSKLSVENRLLMLLMYWRENRTYFHIAQTYGINEGACWRMIAWLEQVLIKSGTFRLSVSVSLPNVTVHAVVASVSVSISSLPSIIWSSTMSLSFARCLLFP